MVYHLQAQLNVVCMYVKGSNAFLLERSSISSLPFAIDDPPKATSRNNSVDINYLIVDFYNGCKTANLRSRSTKPMSIPIMATNFDIKACYEATICCKNRVCSFIH